MGLAFALGLLLTLGLMIRRVTGVVPVASAVKRQPAGYPAEVDERVDNAEDEHGDD